MRIRSIKRIQRAEELKALIEKKLNILCSHYIEGGEVGDDYCIYIEPKGILTQTANEIIQECVNQYHPEAGYYVDNCGTKNGGLRVVVYIRAYVNTKEFNAKGKLITKGGCEARVVDEMAGGYLVAVKTNANGTEECYPVHADEGCVSYDMENINDLYTYED